MLRVGVVVFLAAVVAAECFNTRLWSTQRSLALGPGAECEAWHEHMRTAWCSHLSGDELLMHNQYSAVSGHQFIERFSLQTGSLMDAAPLEDASDIRTAHPSMCRTNYDLFVYAGGDRIDHYDVITGLRRSSTSYPELGDSDRVSLACTNQRVFVSVPSRSSVWELLPPDGLLVHVVARVPSPGALFVRDNLLYVVSGRPAVAVFAFDLDTGASRGVLPTEAVHVRGIVVQEDGTVLALSDERVTQRLATRTDTAVGTDHAFAPFLHELLSAHLGVRNGVLVDARDGSAVAPPTSTLTNNGNVGPLARVPIVPSPDTIALADSTGELALFDVTGACELSFQRYLPPLVANSGLLHVLDASTDGALLYLDRGTGVVWARVSLHDEDRPVDTAVVDPTRGVVCALPVPRACLQGSQDRTVRCHDLQAPTTAVTIALPDAVDTFHWDSQHAGLVAWVAGAEPELWHVSLHDGQWSQRCMVDEHAPDDVAPAREQWHVEQVTPDAFLLRWTAEVALLVDENCSVVHRYDGNLADATLTLAWLHERPTNEAVCIPFNASWPVRHLPSTSDGFDAWLTVGLLLLLTGSVGCLFFAASISCRTAWYICLCRRDKSSNPWQQMEDNRRVGIVSMVCCNRGVQTFVLSLLSGCPVWGERLSATMQKHYSPPVYSARDLSSGSSVATGDDDDDHPPSDMHWSEVQLSPRQGYTAADAASV